jgi:HK97 family phage major capsid protein
MGFSAADRTHSIFFLTGLLFWAEPPSGPFWERTIMTTPESLNEMVSELLREAKEVKAEMQRGDDVRSKAIGELRTKIAKLETALTSLSVRVGRPNGDGSDGQSDARQSALALCEQKHALKVPKHDAALQFSPSEDEITEAALAIQGIRNLLKSSAGNEGLSMVERKALTSFNLGASGYFLPPEMSTRVLSCLTDPTDLAAVMGNITISGSSIKFMVDNAELDQATWACDSDCWSQSSVKKLTEGLGEIELKPEPLRYTICASRDLIEDSSVDIEGWMMTKVSRAIRATLSTALISGNGVGKPLGILNPQAGIPICETNTQTPAGTFSWMDLVALKWEVPVQFHPTGAYLMNQKTFALVLMMSDSNGRPIMLPSPVEPGQYLINGSRVIIATQMPDVAPGATPVAFGAWDVVYLVVTRKAVTMQADPYSAGYCLLYKFEARIGGGIVCPNAARLLRIR